MRLALLTLRALGGFADPPARRPAPLTPEIGVATLRLDKFRTGSFLHDAPRHENENLIRRANGLQAMRDDHGDQRLAVKKRSGRNDLPEADLLVSRSEKNSVHIFIDEAALTTLQQA